MSDIYHRIRSRREELGLSQEELAKRMGYKSKSSINKIEMGINDIPQSKVIAFAKALETTTAYLMGVDDAKESVVSSNILPMPKTYQVPLVGTIACGTPILAEDNIEGTVEVPEFVHADFALRCKGDSMINARIFDGDIVYIRRQNEVENGEIAAVRIGDEATLKKVYYSKDRLVLRAANPLFPDMEYEGPALNDVEILGKAVAFTSVIK